MEPQSTFVRPKGRVELYAIAPIDLNFILIVLPHDAELDDAFGDGSDLEGGLVFWVLLEEGGVLEG